MLLQILFNGLVAGALIAIQAISFSLIYRTTRVFHVAYAATHVATGYAFLVAKTRLGLDPMMAALFAISVSVGLAMLVEHFIYRPLGTNGATPALLGSLGAYLAIVNTIEIIFGSDAQVLRIQVTTWQVAGLVVTNTQLAQLMIAACVLTLTLVVLNGTGTGRRFRALADDVELMETLGYEARRIRTAVVAAATAIGGAAAIGMAIDGVITPHIGFQVLLNAVVAMVIGGAMHKWGPLIGGLTLGLLHGAVTWMASPHWIDTVTFLVLLLFIALRPGGIMQREQRVEEAPA
jgi:branched-chain amino acid transport system permease protein